MPQYELTIVVTGVDNTAPAVQGMERLGVGGVAVGNILADVAVKAGTAIAGLATSSVTAAMDFQNATATFASVAGGALAEAGFSLQDVTDKALELGAVTQFSAAEAQQAMIELAKGGVPVADVMGKATDATLNLAAAGEVGLANAASIVASQLGVWASTGVDAAQVSDLLAQAANASVVGVEELAMGLAQVGGVAKVSGVSFQDINQTMALLSPGFGSASDAGTSLKTMLLALTPKSNEAARVMQELGIITADGANRFYDAQGSMVGMGEVAEILKQSLAGMSEEQKKAALNTIFGTDAFRAAAFMAEAGAAGFDAMGVAMANAGTAAEQAAIRQQTFKFAWDSFLGTLETIQIVIGSALLPILTTLVNDAIIPAANAVLVFAQGILQAADPMAALGAAIAPFLPILAGLASAILYAIVPGFVLWAGAAWTAATATLATLAPALAVGAAVAVLFFAWQNNFLGIQDIVASVWSYLQPIFQQLVEWLQTVIPVAIAAASQLWTGTLLPALQAVGAFITGTVLPILISLGQWLITNIPAAIATASAAFSTIAAAVSSAFATVQSVVQTGVSVVVTVLQAGWNTLVFVTSAAWNAIAGVVGPAIAAVAAVVGPHIQQVVAVMQAAWATLQSVTATAWAAIQMAVSTPIQLIQSIISAAIAFVQSVWTAGMSAATSETAAIWNSVQTIISGAILAIKTVISAGIAIVQTIMKTAWAAVVAAAQNDFGKIPSIIQAGWDRVKTIFNTAVGFIKSIAGVMAGAAMDLGKNIVSGVVSGISSMGNALSDKLKSMAKSALDAAKSVLGIKSPSTVMAAQVGVPIVEGIAQGIKLATPKVNTAMLELAGKVVDLISKGVDAFGKLQELGAISFGSVRAFTQTLQETMNLFGQMTLEWNRAMMSAAGQFTGKSASVVEFISKAVDALLKLQEYEGIPQAVIRSFADNLKLAISELIRISTWDMRLALGAAVEFSASATKVLGVLTAGVDGLNKLRSLGQAVPGSFQNFSLQVIVLVTRMAEVANWVEKSAVAEAGKFAESAGKVLGILASGVDGLTKLNDLGTPIPGIFQQFATYVSALVWRVAQAAQTIQGDGLAKAAEFAESAGKVIGILGSGVDGFAKLNTFKGTTQTAVNLFGEAVLLTVRSIAYVGTFFSSEGATAAGIFAESAGKVVGIIGTGVDGLTKLATFQGITQMAVNLFGEAVLLAVRSIAYVATFFQAEAVAAAAVFSEGAGKVLGIIKAGVDGLSALKDIGPLSQVALDAFGDAIQQLMQKLVLIAVQFSTESIQAAGLFADAAGKSVGILKTGVDGFLLVDTFTGVSEAAIGRFADGVRLAVASMLRLANEFGTEATAAAMAFAKAAGESTDFLKKGVEGFTKLADLKGVPEAGLQVFAQAVVSLINTTIQLGQIVSNEMLAEAIRIANGTDQVIEVVKNSIKAFLTLGEATGQMPNYIQGFVDAVTKLMEQFQRAVVPPATNIGQNIAIGIANGIASGAGAIQNAIFAAVNQALAAARAALGIASPSKVFEEQIGAQMSAGMAKGVMGGLPNVQAAVGLVSTGAISSGGGSTTNNNQRSIVFEAGSIVIGGGGGNAYQTADAVATEIQRRLGMQPV